MGSVDEPTTAPGTPRKARYRIYSTSGVYDYFFKFFGEAGPLAKLVFVAFFLVFLIVPILGGPSNVNARSLESGLVFSGLNFVFYLTAAALYRFNLSLSDPRLKHSGRVVMAMIIVPISIYSFLAVFSAALGSEVISVLRVTSSVVIIIPLVLIISLLVESVIRRGTARSHSRVPLLLVLVTILLIMLTFAIVYFVNGMLVKTVTPTSTELVQVNFEDALFFSGEIFTTLGSNDIFAIGVGKGVMLFESVAGYLALGFLSAIFIQAIITARESDRS
jgi:hypothetical protein